MSKRLRAGFVFSVFVLSMFSVPRLRAQQVDGKDSADKGAPEQKIPEQKPEKRPVNTFGGHCELTTCVNKVFYLSNISQPTELQNFVNLMRTIGEVSRIQQLPSEQLVVVRGTPEQIAFAEQMAAEINKDRRRFGGIGYRLDFKVSQSAGAKKMRSHSYSLLTEGRETARLGIGRQMPVSTSLPTATPLSTPASVSETAHAPVSPAPVHTTGISPVPTSALSQNVAGRHIECRVVSESERTIELFVDAALCSPPTSQTPRSEKMGSNGSGGAYPTLMCVRDRVILELGEPTVIARVDDPERERTFQLEVTATRVMEKQ
jgi:hypothetical protein